MALVLLTPVASTLLFCLPTLAVIWLAGAILYRIWLHPLADTPGPRVAAVTHLYAFFFNAVGGPVVRITPNEVHFSDPETYEKIYRVGTKYLKSPDFYGAFALDTSTFGTTNNDLHRLRRAALNPVFSRRVVLELEDVVQSKVLKLCRKVGDEFHANRPVNLHNGFRAPSVDIITDYAFDNCYDLLDQAGFGADYFAMIRALVSVQWVFIQFPFLQFIAMNTSLWLVRLLNEPLRNYLRMQKDCRDQAMAVKATVDASQGKSPRETIFHQLLNPDAAEGRVVPSVDELVDEAFGIVGAASEITGNAMTITIYYILSDSEIYRRLIVELTEFSPDPAPTLDFTKLEKLPYLTAVIKESLRLCFGIIGRLPRVTPQPGDVLSGYAIPPGSIVGMSAWIMHRNETIFPTPEKFDPKRWLDLESAKKLDKYLVSFSKGTRQCVGMNLVYCELYVALATLFRRFERLKIYDTGPEDLVYEDYFSPFHPLSARQLQVVLKAP